MRGMCRWILAVLILALTAGAAAGVSETEAPALGALEDAAVEAYFSDRDLSGEWKEKNAVSIRWEGGNAVCAGGEAEIAGGSVVIRQAGVYVLSGSGEGSVTVDAGKEDKVQLVLQGLRLSSSGAAAILVENADKAFITLAEGTENVLTAASFGGENGVDAAIFSRDDLTLGGAGSLTVSSARHGIVGKDDLKITGGEYRIEAEGRGIDANDSLRVCGGKITVVSGQDALRARHEEESKGWVLILGGEFDLTAGGGAQNGRTHTEDWDFRGRSGRNQAAAAESEKSCKGIKASGSLVIQGGSITIDAADDALHTDGGMTVRGGTLTLSSGDDGMHADGVLRISGGDVRILTSYEGLEAQNIEISGGDISLKASDDGLNAAGGKDGSGYGWQDMFASDGVSSIEISGGALYIDAAGDGMDSNGDLTVTGGVTVVSGPTNSGNGALDYNGSGVITGGSVIAAGAIGMAESFGAGSTQPSVLVRLSGRADSEITVRNADGKIILSGTVGKQFNCVVISCPDMRVGETYTVSSGSASVQVTVSAVSERNGDNGFGPSGGGPGRR